MTTPTDPPVIARVRAIVNTIADDLGLEIYDIEQRGGTLRVTLDTPPGSPSGVTLEQITLATRLINREFDHEDPVPGRYTLEVSSPGVERNLRTPAHFQREVGKVVALRLVGVDADQRRLTGTLVAADDATATIQPVDQPEATRVVSIASIDRARTVFEWGPQPKPGSAAAKSRAKGARTARGSTPESSADHHDIDVHDDDVHDDTDVDDEIDGAIEFEAIQPGAAGTRPDKETT